MKNFSFSIMIIRKKMQALLHIALVMITITSCSTKQMISVEERAKDINSLYSTHPDKPYKYGPVISKNELQEYRPLFEAIGIGKGMKVADVGAGSGWMSGVFSTMVDDVTFFIQDINTNFLNEAELKKMTSYYGSFNEQSKSNSFQMAIGTKKSSNLPDKYFDIIFIYNSYHEFLFENAMIDDLKKKLLPDGKLVIIDLFSNNYLKLRHEGCNITGQNINFFYKKMKNKNLNLIGMAAPPNSLYNIFTFQERNIKDELGLYLDMRKVHSLCKVLDGIYIEKNYRDSTALINIVESVKPHLDSLKMVYPLLDLKLWHLGQYLVRENKIQEGINIHKANLRIFPNDYRTYESLGEAYIKLNNFKEARQYLLASLSYQPSNESAQKLLESIAGK